MKDELYRNLAEVEADHWWFRGRRAVLEGVLRGLDLPRSAEVLEVGCGVGGNLDLLRRFGAVSAVEPHPVGRSLAQAKGIGRVEEGSLPGSLPFGQQRFDLLVLADVLEHVQADDEALRALLDRAKPGGHLLITVPAVPELWAPHDEVHEHFRRYRRRDLVRVLQDAGWQVQRVSHWNTLLLPVAGLVRLAQRAMGAQARPIRIPPLWANHVGRAVLGLERALARWVPMPLGLSLVALARRPDRLGNKPA